MAEDDANTESERPQRTIEGEAREVGAEAGTDAPAARRWPPRWRRLGLVSLGAGLAATLAVLAILAVLAVSGAVPSLIGLGEVRDGLAGVGSDISRNREAIADLAARTEAATGDLSARLDQATEKAATAQSAGAALGARLTDLAGRVAALAEGEDAATTEIARLSAALADIQAAGRATPTGEAASPSPSMQPRLAALEAASAERGERLGALAEDLAGLERRLAAAEERLAAEAGAGLWQNLEALRRAAQAGRPFAPALEALAASLPEAPEVAALRPFAAAPPPSTERLALDLSQMPASADRAPAGEAEATSLWGRLARSAGRLVKVQRAGEARVSAARAEAGELLGAGDVAGAVARIEEADGAGHRAWLGQARARLALDDAVGRLAARVAETAGTEP